MLAAVGARKPTVRRSKSSCPTPTTTFRPRYGRSPSSALRSHLDKLVVCEGRVRETYARYSRIERATVIGRQRSSPRVFQLGDANSEASIAAVDDSAGGSGRGGPVEGTLSNSAWQRVLASIRHRARRRARAGSAFADSAARASGAGPFEPIGKTAASPRPEQGAAPEVGAGET